MLPPFLLLLSLPAHAAELLECLLIYLPSYYQLTYVTRT